MGVMQLRAQSMKLVCGSQKALSNGRAAFTLGYTSEVLHVELIIWHIMFFSLKVASYFMGIGYLTVTLLFTWNVNASLVF